MQLQAMRLQAPSRLRSAGRQWRTGSSCSRHPCVPSPATDRGSAPRSAAESRAWTSTLRCSSRGPRSAPPHTRRRRPPRARNSRTRYVAKTRPRRGRVRSRGDPRRCAPSWEQAHRPVVRCGLAQRLRPPTHRSCPRTCSTAPALADPRSPERKCRRRPASSLWRAAPAARRWRGRAPRRSVRGAAPGRHSRNSRGAADRSDGAPAIRLHRR